MMSPCNSTEHPWEPSRKIFVICDVPHIVKCTRNHLKKHIYGMVIKDFLEMLNSTEKNSVEQGLKLSALEQTTESLRVTLMSTLEIIEFLLYQGAHYVLTAKLKQDPPGGEHVIAATLSVEL
ncbi:hypothetical protein MTO96_024718 [Rhipicephalus appendiculatus]